MAKLDTEEGRCKGDAASVAGGVVQGAHAPGQPGDGRRRRGRRSLAISSRPPTPLACTCRGAPRLLGIAHRPHSTATQQRPPCLSIGAACRGEPVACCVADQLH